MSHATVVKLKPWSTRLWCMGVMQVNQEMSIQITLRPILHQSYTVCPQMSHMASFVTPFLKLRHTPTRKAGSSCSFSWRKRIQNTLKPSNRDQTVLLPTEPRTDTRRQLRINAPSRTENDFFFFFNLYRQNYLSKLGRRNISLSPSSPSSLLQVIYQRFISVVLGLCTPILVSPSSLSYLPALDTKYGTI